MIFHVTHSQTGQQAFVRAPSLQRAQALLVQATRDPQWHASTATVHPEQGGDAVLYLGPKPVTVSTTRRKKRSADKA